MSESPQAKEIAGVGLALGQPGVPLSEILEVSKAADAAGAVMLGVGDGFTEAFSLLGALSACTEKAALVTAIATWTRTPITTAVGLAALQALSGGRATLGVGTMPKNWSEDWHGVDFSHPLRRMRDFIAAIRAAYDAEVGQLSSYDGLYYKFKDYSRLSAPTGFPLRVMIAATGPQMTGLAGEIADGAIMNTICSPEWLVSKSLPALIAGAERGGKDPNEVSRSALVYCSIDSDESLAIDQARSGLAFYYRTPYFPEILEWHGFGRELAQGLKALSDGDDVAATRSVSDEMVRTFCLAGTSEQVLERLHVYARNYDWIELSSPVGSAPEDTLRMLHQIISDIPAMNEVFRVASATKTKRNP